MLKHISHSSQNLFWMCGYQFYMRYIEGKRTPPSIHMLKGGAVHSGAEHTNRTKFETGNSAPFDEVEDCARDEFVHRTKDEGVWLQNEEKSSKKRLLNDGLNESIAMASSYWENRSKAHRKIQVVEDLLKADIGLDLPIVGKPDLIADHINEDLKVSGKKMNAGLEHLSLQPTFYKILAKENNIADMAKYKSAFLIMTGYKNAPKYTPYIWDKKRRIAFDYRMTERTDADEERLKKRIELMIEMVNKGIFMPAEIGHWICTPEKCAYWGYCPYSKR